MGVPLTDLVTLSPSRVIVFKQIITTQWFLFICLNYFTDYKLCEGRGLDRIPTFRTVPGTPQRLNEYLLIK